MLHEELLNKIEAIDYWQEHFANKTFMKVLLAVVELHKPDDSNFCTECTHDFNIISYPCPTAEVIEKAIV